MQEATGRERRPAGTPSDLRRATFELRLFIHLRAAAIHPNSRIASCIRTVRVSASRVEMSVACALLIIRAPRSAICETVIRNRLAPKIRSPNSPWEIEFQKRGLKIGDLNLRLFSRSSCCSGLITLHGWLQSRIDQKSAGTGEGSTRYSSTTREKLFRGRV
jgi:hypothetical protein